MILYLMAGLVLFLFFGTMFYAWVFGAPTVYTPYKAVVRMVSEVNLKNGQIVYDLGCGDGRILFEAVKKKNVLALGFEIFFPVFIWAKIKSYFRDKKGVAKINFGDFWYKDFHPANVIFCFLTPKSMRRVGEKFIGEAKKGACLVSYAFKVDGLPPQKVVRIKGLAPIYVYIKN